ncbi:uncharacterized protein TNCV_4729401 [Trichonephila clavipes]|nr:uncharacterized protein TNCV_4729401 [Trichonephila clavipes]
MVPQFNTRGDRVLMARQNPTITPAVLAVCRCKAKAELKRLPQGLHTRTRLSSLLNRNLSLKTTWFYSTAHLCFLLRGTTPNEGVHGWASKAARVMGADPKCPSTRRLRMVREDTGAPSEGATCSRIAADEVVGSTRAFLTM